LGPELTDEDTDTTDVHAEANIHESPQDRGCFARLLKLGVLTEDCVYPLSGF
jgi:hypothetical protein